MAEAVQPLTDGAKQFLASRFKDITKLQKEVKALPLAGMEAIESSDDLQIASEDAVYDMSSVLCHGETSTNELSFWSSLGWKRDALNSVQIQPVIALPTTSSPTGSWKNTP